MTPRRDDILGNLPEEDREKLTEWILNLSYRQAQAQIAKPPPEGLGLNVSIATIGRFYSRNCALQMSNESADILEACRALKEEPSDKETLGSAALQALRQRLFRMCISSKSNPNHIRAVFAVLHKVRDLDLEERRTVLLEKRAALATRLRRWPKAPT